MFVKENVNSDKNIFQFAKLNSFESVIYPITMISFSYNICWHKTFQGDPKAWLKTFFFVFTVDYIANPTTVFIISYRGYGLAIIILHLIMYDDFDIMGIVIDISCHTTDLGSWNTKDNNQLALYFVLYAIRYYVIYMCFLRPMLA